MCAQESRRMVRTQDNLEIAMTNARDGYWRTWRMQRFRGDIPRFVDEPENGTKQV